MRENRQLRTRTVVGSFVSHIEMLEMQFSVGPHRSLPRWRCNIVVNSSNTTKYGKCVVAKHSLVEFCRLSTTIESRGCGCVTGWNEKLNRNIEKNDRRLYRSEDSHFDELNSYTRLPCCCSCPNPSVYIAFDFPALNFTINIRQTDTQTTMYGNMAHRVRSPAIFHALQVKMQFTWIYEVLWK